MSTKQGVQVWQSMTCQRLEVVMVLLQRGIPVIEFRIIQFKMKVDHTRQEASLLWS